MSANHIPPPSTPPLRLDDEALTALVAEDGYEPGAPLDGLGMTAIDVAVAQQARCPHCGHQGLGCRQFINRRSGRYRVYTRCPGCAAVEQF